MSPRPSPVAFVVVSVLGMIVGSLVTRPSLGLAPAAAAPHLGRFQTSIAAYDRSILVITDTMAGQVWVRELRRNDTWQDLGIPADSSNKEGRAGDDQGGEPAWETFGGAKSEPMTVTEADIREGIRGLGLRKKAGEVTLVALVVRRGGAGRMTIFPDRCERCIDAAACGPVE